MDFGRFAAAQSRAEFEDTSLQIQEVVWNGVTMLCDTSTGTLRPFVPPAFRQAVFDHLHGLSHPGTRPSIKLISSRFVWPGIYQVIRGWCRTCHPCQAAKVARHIRTPLTVLPPAS